ncbi:heme exporter protein CcmB [Rubrivirga sp. S365]|uniref:Heme exporter protein CcmB n=1 Tax=Rubrivirga litoralis TaxID=3075598 RepID=A0ABU3BVI0_9BACT|nr:MULTISPECIES: heme exporter protein CcmB [unclassified Rubrivirga]MDT0633299.1 heme exporter protein CcmB [Rubrivirga sp. F394]MDT7855120.1 heme exporter protein CcmB [Rubrivirga sp. S365]
MNWLAGAWAVVANDARLELRTRVALGALGMFVAASLVLVRVALGRGAPSVSVAAALLWVVVVFAAAVGLGRAFVAEEERGTSLLLQLHLRPSQVYAGKLAFNVALMAALGAVAALGFRVLVPTPLGAPAVLAAALALGALGLAAATTLLSAIVARSQAAGPLLPVLAFPLVVPVLIPAVELTELAAGAPTGAWAAAQGNLVLLAAYAGLLVSASFLLFDYVWRD